MTSWHERGVYYLENIHDIFNDSREMRILCAKLSIKMSKHIPNFGLESFKLKENT